MSLSEVKALAEKLGLEVEGTGAGGRKLKADYERALEEHYSKGKKGKQTSKKTPPKKKYDPTTEYPQWLAELYWKSKNEPTLEQRKYLRSDGYITGDDTITAEGFRLLFKNDPELIERALKRYQKNSYGINENILKSLSAAGYVDRTEYGHRLTAKGRDKLVEMKVLFPVLDELPDTSVLDKQVSGWVRIDHEANEDESAPDTILFYHSLKQALEELIELLFRQHDFGGDQKEDENQLRNKFATEIANGEKFYEWNDESGEPYGDKSFKVVEERTIEEIRNKHKQTRKLNRK